MPLDSGLAAEANCYLTTAGRVTGRPHTIEIWFAAEESTLYLISGGGDASDWVKNARRTPSVSVRIRDRHFKGRLRPVESPEEDELGRRLLVGKYQPGYSGDLAGWSRALLVAIDLDG